MAGNAPDDTTTLKLNGVAALTNLLGTAQGKLLAGGTEHILKAQSEGIGLSVAQLEATHSTVHLGRRRLAAALHALDISSPR